MKPRQIRGDVFWVGAIDWKRRLFDSLIPLPDGTSTCVPRQGERKNGADRRGRSGLFETTLKRQLAEVQAYRLLVAQQPSRILRAPFPPCGDVSRGDRGLLAKAKPCDRPLGIDEARIRTSRTANLRWAARPAVFPLAVGPLARDDGHAPA
jgi:hypothetical protein